MKKTFEIIKKVFAGVILVIYFTFVIAMTMLLLNFNEYGVSQFGKKSLIIIADNISKTDYKMGDLLIIESKKLDEVEKGDEIFTYRVENNGSVSVDVGKIGEKYEEENAIAFENGATYSMDFAIGKHQKTYRNVGRYLAVIESKWGFFFIVLVPSFLIFVYQVYNLIIEIKYGKEEAPKEEKEDKKEKKKDSKEEK